MKNFRFLLILIMLGIVVVSCKSKNQAPADNGSAAEASEVSGGDSFFGQEAPKLLDPITIEFGDYDGMFDFSKKCQNAEFAEGQVVTIEGELSTDFFPPSIGQRKGDEYSGTQIDVKGLTKDNLPSDRSRVKVTAKTVKNNDYYYLYLTAEAADFTVIEAASDE